MRAPVLIGLALVAACARPEQLAWPVANDGGAVISVVIQDLEGERRIFDPPAVGVERVDHALAPGDEVVVIEYAKGFAELSAVPPIVRTDSAGASNVRPILQHPELSRPDRVWRLGPGAAEFVADFEAKLPPELAPYSIADPRICPVLETSQLDLPAPARGLIRGSRDRALVILENGELARFEGDRVELLDITRTSTEPIDAGYALADGRLIVGDRDGVIWSLDWDTEPPTMTLINRLFHAPRRGLAAIVGSPDGTEMYAGDRSGQIVRVLEGVNTTLLELDPPDDCDGRPGTHCTGPLSLGWIRPGEALLAWRAIDFADHAVYRLCTRGGITTAGDEPFGDTSAHRPDTLARIGGYWRISGTDQGSLLGYKSLYQFDPRARTWISTYALTEAVTVRGLVDAPSWDGFAFAAQSGRFAVQPDFSNEQICPSKVYSQTDSRGMIALSDGRFVLGVDRADTLVVLAPRVLPPKSMEIGNLEPSFCPP